jgi:hypothetical protein
VKGRSKNECLTEDALIELLLDEGSADTQVHVRSCAVCTRNYRNLAQQMKLIETALSGLPPQPSIGLRLLPWIRAMTPAMAAAVAIFIAGFWLGQRFLPSHAQPAPVSIAESLPPVNGPLALADQDKVQLWNDAGSTTASYVTFLQDNFEQDDACLSQDHAFNLACSRSWLAGSQ